MTDQVKMIKIPRQTAFLKMPKEDVEKYLKEVESHFGKAWLETQAGHRLQILWERSDSNSTIDLVSLGYALKTISERHPEWLKGCVGDILSDDPKRQNGALFELNLIAWFINGGMNVLPASYGEKGIDATLKFQAADDLFISMKNHDMSHHEQTLHQNCERIRNKARDLCKKQGCRGITVTLTSKEYLSSDSDWRAIEKAVEEWPALKSVVEERQVIPGIHLFVGQLGASKENLDAGFISDSFAVFMPYHKNEQPNFKQKLNDAITQLKQKCADKTGKKAVFMRLHQTANMPEMTEFATELISEEGCAADLIVLYQPAYINNQNLDQTSPSQYFSFIRSPGWEDQKYPIKMQAAVAVHIQNPSKQKMIWPDGSLRDPLKDHYMYYVGQHFVATQMDQHGKGTANIQRRPNLSIYPVFQGHIVAGLLPPNDEFLVL